MGLAKNFFSQTRKPEGFLGKMMLGTMNSGHAKLADWGFDHLPEMTPESAVDLGCGGCRNTEKVKQKLTKLFPKRCGSSWILPACRSWRKDVSSCR